jgi:hypothetical protein
LIKLRLRHRADSAGGAVAAVSARRGAPYIRRVNKIDESRTPDPSGRDPRVVNLVVAAIVVAMLALMVWLAHELTHASHVIDCATQGLRNCQ